MIKLVDRPLLTPEGADYLDIIQSNVKDLDPQKTTGEGSPADITFYCRICKTIIEKPERIAKTLRFKCTGCNQSRVAFGGRQSVQNYFKLREERTEAKNLI